MTQPKEHQIEIFYSKDDEGWIAEIPELKFCSAFGKTPQMALTEVLVAKEVWLESAKSNRKEVPKPQARAKRAI